jgi:hypothetical protein
MKVCYATYHQTKISLFRMHRGQHKAVERLSAIMPVLMPRCLHCPTILDFTPTFFMHMRSAARRYRTAYCVGTCVDMRMRKNDAIALRPCLSTLGTFMVRVYKQTNDVDVVWLIGIWVNDHMTFSFHYCIGFNIRNMLFVVRRPLSKIRCDLLFLKETSCFCSFVLIYV